MASLLGLIRKLIQRPPKQGQIVVVENVPFRFLGAKYDKIERKRIPIWRCRVCMRTTNDAMLHAWHERREREAWQQEMQSLRESYGISEVKP